MEVCEEWAYLNKLKFSTSKCSYILLKGNLSRNPTIKIHNLNIRRETQTKYLGIILDTHLNYSTHVSYVCNKATNLLMALRRYIRRNWGSPPNAIHTIIQGAVLPTIQYGCEIWGHAASNARNKRRLTSLSSLCSKILTSSYSSVSNDASHVLAHLVPFHYQIEVTKAKKHLKTHYHCSLLGNHYSILDFQNQIHFMEFALEAVTSIWQQHWEASDKGRLTFQFFPDIKARASLTFPHSHLLSQILTGYGDFNMHLLRIGKREDALCDVCRQEDSSTHRIYDCPLYHDERNSLIAAISNWPIMPEELAAEILGSRHELITELECIAIRKS